MKKINTMLAVFTLIGMMCFVSGCDRFGDAVLDGVFGLVSEVAADFISVVLPLDLIVGN